MPRFTLTYGDLPSYEQFSEAWDASHRSMTDGRFSFKNDPIVGNDSLSKSEMWEKLQWVWNEYADKLGGYGLGDDPEKQGSWLADVLSCLGIEWV